MSLPPLVGKHVHVPGTDDYGLVEVRAADTPMPKTHSHMLPEIGHPFVRLLKSDGTPSKRIERLKGFGGDRKWELCEG